MMKKSSLFFALLAGMMLFCGCDSKKKNQKIEQKKEAEETAEKQSVKMTVESLFRERLNREIKCVDIVNSKEIAPNTYDGKAIFLETKKNPPFDTEKYYVEIRYEFIADNVSVSLLSRDVSGLSMNAADEKYASEQRGKAEMRARQEAERRAEEARRAAEARRIAEARRAEEARRAAEARRIAEARRAEEARKEAEKLKPYTNCKLPGNVTMGMVICPAGNFTMGSPADEPRRVSDETQHRVTLTKPFLIGKYEVTQAQYEAVMGNNPSGFKGPNRPVECVSWHDAMEFCEKLNALTEGKRPAGYEFTLPTEAQWEYACRAGTTGVYAGDFDSMACDNSDFKTHDVGQKRPNAWGIYDMHGNVCEWCRDWYGSYTGDATDPAGTASGSSRVNRGGSWSNDARYCRSASRADDDPGHRHYDLGFRVALVPVQ